MSCCMKRSRTLEMVSNIQRKKFALNVRRDGPQPSILVRSFRSFTTRDSVHWPDGKCAQCSDEFDPMIGNLAQCSDKNRCRLPNEHVFGYTLQEGMEIRQRLFVLEIRETMNSVDKHIEMC